MAMTKKHYEIVSDVLGAYYSIDDVIVKKTIESIVDSLCDRFEANDSNFNKDKFLKECGL